MGVLRRLLVAVMVLIGGAAAAAEPPPPPLTQQQFDTLVDALSKAVAEKLKAQAPSDPAPPAAAAAPAAPAKASPTGAPAEPMAMMGEDEPTNRRFLDLVVRGGTILTSFPELLSHLGRIPGYLTAPLNGGRGPGLYLLLLAVAAVVTLGAEALLRMLLTPLRLRLARRIDGPSGLWPLLGIFAIDALGLFACWVAAYGFIAAWFPGTVPQSRLAYLVLTSLFSWRIYMVAFRVALRPTLPEARLADIGDADARAIYRRIGALMALILVVHGLLRILAGIGAPDEVVACGVLIDAILIPAALIVAALTAREPMARWLRGLSRAGAPGPVQAVLARYWFVAAVPYFLALGLARAYGAIAEQSGILTAITTTMNTLIGLLLLESLLDKVGRLLGRDPDQVHGHQRGRVVAAIVRCLRVAILIGAAVLLVRTWAVDTMAVMDSNGYSVFTRAAFAAGGTLLAAYCAWQVVKLFTDRYANVPKPAMPGHDDTEGEAEGSSGSRLATLMPLLRVVILVALCVMAALTMLSQLGVNITPLIAGASIVGLAVSFGSQTLVKDIVSGVFYLVDDAFRVGEYIDCGKAKGTVEGFTLRSLRLRHQNGQVHTIPFGQLGQITNFSRDWATIKFTLRFARNTDIEKLRKAVKKIGQEMMEEPELKDEFLVPLKMQGISDIADSALIVRFKFTVKPNKPTFVQREAIKRMIRVLPEQGIEFANATVSVQSLAGPGEHAAAAAATAMAAKASAEREAVAAGT